MGLFSRGNKKLFAVFDIGSASIGGALVSIDKNGSATVLQTVRKDILFQERIDHKRFFTTVLATFDKVCEELQGTAGKEAVDEVVIFFGAPWYASCFDTITLREAKAFRVTENLVEREVKNRVTAFEQKSVQVYGESDLGAPKLIEEEKTSVRLNGYQVAKYDRKKAKNLAIAFYASVVPENVLFELQQRVFNRYSDRDIEFRSFPFASLITLRDVLGQADNSFLFLEITGEMVDLLWVRKGVIEKQASFPLGRNFLLRSVAETLRVSLKEAESLIAMVTAGKADEQTSVRLKEALHGCRLRWKKAFEARTQFLEHSVSERIFLATDPTYAWWFQDVLADYTYITADSESLSSVHLLGDMLDEEMCAFKDGAARDDFLATEATFLAHIHSM